MIKKFLVGLIILIFLSGIFNIETVEAKPLFSDTSNHWAKGAIEFLHNKGIVRGLPNGKFGVDNNISRGDAAIMIARAKGLNLDTNSNQSSFTDVSPGSYYYKEVIAASKAGYLNGYPDKTFKPQGKLTREEMAKILVIAYGLNNNGGAVFKDVKVKSWSFTSIQTLVSNKITNGFPDKTFQPQKSISRSEFAMLLTRTIDESFRDPNFKLDNSFDSIEEEAKYVIENYSPNSYFILNTVSSKEGKSIERLISEWKNDHNLFSTINLAVHEETHGLQYLGDFLTFGQNGRVIINHKYVLGSSIYVVGHYPDSMFLTEEMATKLPTSLRTYRWETYVAPGSSVTANQYGPYGLLDELSAYYQGDKAAYDSYDYLLTLPYSAKNWQDYYASLDGEAFYEFKFWTLSYLLYAKEIKPDVYKSIMNDTRYKTAFKRIYNDYLNYVEVLKPAREKQIVKDLQGRGIEARINNEYLYIGGTGRGSGIDVTAIKNEMTQVKYTSILNELLK